MTHVVALVGALAQAATMVTETQFFVIAAVAVVALIASAKSK